MTDRPLILSGLEVRAVIESRKTQFRRVLKPQPNALNGGLPLNNGYGSYSTEDGWKKYPYALGDRLWVKETFVFVGSGDPGWLLYRANGYDAECKRHGFDKCPPESEVKWKSSTQMPRTASRLTLVVTDVRVQRVREITDEDALAEGAVEKKWTNECDQHRSGWRMDWPSKEPAFGWGSICLGAPRFAFANWWNERAKRGHGWTANPWVVAVTFEKETADV
jgi:hypothetical protein